MHRKSRNDGSVDVVDVQDFVAAAILKIGSAPLSGPHQLEKQQERGSDDPSGRETSADESQQANLDRASELRRLEQELATTRQVLNQRNSDLGRITNYIRGFDEERASLQALTKDVDRKLKTLRSSSRSIKDNVEPVREKLADFEFQHASSKLNGKGAYTLSSIEHALLHDLARARLSRDDVAHLALKAKLFSYDWYCSTYDLTFASAKEAAAHYFDSGHTLGYEPSLAFSGSDYLKLHKDVAQLKLNPLEHYIKFGVCEPRRFPTTHTLGVKVIMMQKDEGDLIYPWALFHGTLFGFHNLVIIDNGSTEPVLSRLRRLEALGTRVIYDYQEQSHFVSKGDIIASIIQEYDATDPADFYFPLDCDEFIGVEQDDGEMSFQASDIFAELAKYRGSKNALVVKTYLDNHPQTPGMFKKTGGQRKSFFSTKTCVSLDRGFNNPKVVDHGGRQDTRLVYVHYHNKPHYLLQEHARRRLEPFLSDFSTKSLQTYISEKKTGYHSAQHLLTSARDYITRIDDKRYAPLPGFIEFFANLGVRLPFSDLVFWNTKEI